MRASVARRVLLTASPPPSPSPQSGPPPPSAYPTGNTLSGCTGPAPPHCERIHRWRDKSVGVDDSIAVYSPYMQRFCEVHDQAKQSRINAIKSDAVGHRPTGSQKRILRSVHLYTLIRPMRGSPWRSLDVDATSSRKGVTLHPLEDGTVLPPVPMELVRRATSEHGELMTLIDRLVDDGEFEAALDQLLELPDDRFQSDDTGSVSTWQDVLLNGRGEHGETALHLCLECATPAHRRLAIRLLHRFALVPVEEGGSSARFIDAAFTSHTKHGLRAVHMALMRGDRDMLLLLLRLGANVRDAHADGHLFAMRMSTYFGGSCLGLAIAQGQHQLVADLLSLPLGLRPNINGVDLGPFLIHHYKPPSLIAIAASTIQAVQRGRNARRDARPAGSRAPPNIKRRSFFASRASQESSGGRPDGGFECGSDRRSERDSAAELCGHPTVGSTKASRWDALANRDRSTEVGAASVGVSGPGVRGVIYGSEARVVHNWLPVRSRLNSHMKWPMQSQAKPPVKTKPDHWRNVKASALRKRKELTKSQQALVAEAAVLAEESAKNLLRHLTFTAHGNTPVHVCVLHGDIKMLHALLEHGGANIRNRRGDTPLTLAASFGSADMFEAVLDAMSERVWSHGRVRCVRLPLLEIETLEQTRNLGRPAVLELLVQRGARGAHLLRSQPILRLLSDKWLACARWVWLLDLIMILLEISLLAAVLTCVALTARAALRRFARPPTAGLCSTTCHRCLSCASL